MYDDNLFALDTTGVPEMSGGSYEVFPEGFYPAMMVTASLKPTSRGDGKFLECVYQIMETEHAGKKYTSRINVENPNPDAVRIAAQEMKSLRVALGYPDNETRTMMFLNKPLVLKLGVKPRKDKPLVNENNLLAILRYEGAQTQQPQYQPAPQPPQYAQQPQFQNAPQPGFGQPVMPTMQPQQPAFTPNTAKPPPWMATR